MNAASEIGPGVIRRTTFPAGAKQTVVAVLVQFARRQASVRVLITNLPTTTRDYVGRRVTEKMIMTANVAPEADLLAVAEQSVVAIASYIATLLGRRLVATQHQDRDNSGGGKLCSAHHDISSRGTSRMDGLVQPLPPCKFWQRSALLVPRP
jgi:hypothetical protein